MVINVDFDGTLAIGDTSYIPSMKPNISLVNILNKMYQDGNEINVVTARGAKSCQNKKERESKYFDVIAKWLKVHNVLYSNLCFNKEYGDIYLDDKCINIKNSINYNLLDSRFTKNKVRRVNEFVVKRSASSVSEYKWYSHASEFVTTAEVLSYDRDTITTRHIQGTAFDNPNLSVLVLSKFKNQPPISEANFNSYIDRIKSHSLKNKNLVNVTSLVDRLKDMDVPNTFNHGDFSVDNMIQTKSELILIDPIFSPNLFQSYYLDIAKHLFTILYYNLDYDLYDKCLKAYIELGIKESEIDILICSESIRVSTYKNSMTSISNNLIEAIA
jgi:hypothetical protein